MNLGKTPLSSQHLISVSVKWDDNLKKKTNLLFCRIIVDILLLSNYLTHGECHEPHPAHKGQVTVLCVSFLDDYTKTCATGVF